MAQVLHIFSAPEGPERIAGGVSPRKPKPEPEAPKGRKHRRCRPFGATRICANLRGLTPPAMRFRPFGPEYERNVFPVMTLQTRSKQGQRRYYEHVCRIQGVHQIRSLQVVFLPQNPFRGDQQAEQDQHASAVPQVVVVRIVGGDAPRGDDRMAVRVSQVGQVRQTRQGSACAPSILDSPPVPLASRGERLGVDGTGRFFPCSAGPRW